MLLSLLEESTIEVTDILYLATVKGNVCHKHLSGDEREVIDTAKDEVIIPMLDNDAW